MGEWIIISCAVSLFWGKNRVICDVRADRYFFEFVHD